VFSRALINLKLINNFFYYFYANYAFAIQILDKAVKGIKQVYGLSMNDPTLSKILDESGVGNLQHLYGSAGSIPTGLCSLLVTTAVALFVL